MVDDRLARAFSERAPPVAATAVSFRMSHASRHLPARRLAEPHMPASTRRRAEKGGRSRARLAHATWASQGMGADTGALSLDSRMGTTNA
jgi:hypothetical protein